MMMTEKNLARLRAHRNNIHRYRRLLRTHLTELERQYIENRLSAEVEAAKRISHATLPFAIGSRTRPSAKDDPLCHAEVWNWIEGGLGSPSATSGPG
jgi:hypothetical protein